MSKVRVLMAVEPQVLCDLLTDRFQAEPDVQIVGTSQDAIDTLLAVRRTEAGVVVTVTEGDEMPAVCSHLFGEFPNVIVLAISADAKRARLYRQQVCETPVPMVAPQDLLASMRLLLAKDDLYASA